MRRTVWGAVLATVVLLAGAGLVSRPEVLTARWSARASGFVRGAADAGVALADRCGAAVRSGDASRAVGDALRVAGDALRGAVAGVRSAVEARAVGAGERPATDAPWTPPLLTDHAPWVAAGAAAILVIALALAWLARPRGSRAALVMIRRGRPLAGIARRTHLSQDALRFLRRRNVARAGRGA